MNEFNNLGKEGLFIDMHFHTNHSDGSTRLRSISKVCKKKNVGVAITDHNEIKGCLKARHYDFKFIPGIETRSYENVDLLFYFYDINGLKEFYDGVVKNNKVNKVKYRGLRLNAVEILDLSKRYNCISCIPHPFSLLHFAGIKKDNGYYINRGMYKDGIGIIKRVDAIEVINGHLLKKRNMKAVELAYDFNKAYTGGSDGHIRFDLGKVLTYAKGENIEEFLKGVMCKRNSIYIYNGSLRRMIISRTWAFRKHIIHPIHYVNRFINYGKKKIKENV